MLAAIANVEEFTNGVSAEEFVNSKVLFFAVVKNIEIVGEATYMLTKEFKESHRSIPACIEDAALESVDGDVKHKVRSVIDVWRKQYIGHEIQIQNPAVPD